MTSIAEKPKRSATQTPASPTRPPSGQSQQSASSSSSKSGHSPTPARHNNPAGSASTDGSGRSASGRTSALTHQSSTGSLLGNMRSTRDRDIMNLVPSAADCPYAACFCEENVWKLCDHVRTNSPDELTKAFVVFISNKKQVRLHCHPH